MLFGFKILGSDICVLASQYRLLSKLLKYSLTYLLALFVGFPVLHGESIQ